jgi:hypothetical protein
MVRSGSRLQAFDTFALELLLLRKAVDRTESDGSVHLQLIQSGRPRTLRRRTTSVSPYDYEW